MNEAIKETACTISFFFTVVPYILVLSKLFYSPTDAQVNCLKNNFKIYIKIYIKTALTCIGAVTINRECIIRAC
jgi:hypothetical protein